MMKCKKILMTVLAGAFMLASFGMANATININIYGASAQYLFWYNLGTPFLQSAGCSGITSGQYNNSTTPSDSNNGKYAYVKGLACSNYGDDVIIRVASKSSYDGIWAASQVDPAATCGAGYADQRPQIVETTLNYNGQTGAYQLLCQHVDVGASDVSAKAFTQTSRGYKLGPMGGSAATFQENINVYSSTPVSDAGLSRYTPLIIPYGFFLNTAVVSGTCSGGTVNGMSMNGQPCPVNTPTGYPASGSVTGVNSYCGTGGTCVVGNVQGFSRQQIELIFTGSLTNWDQLGFQFPNMPMQVCFRHAGSGTLATLDKAVVDNIGWGAALPTQQRTGNLGGYYIWFNDGTADEMRCINGDNAGGTITAGPANVAPYNNQPSGGPDGCVGFADSDQAANISSTYGGNNTYPYVYGPVMYNGYMPYRWNVRNGAYDNFWTLEHMYYNPAEPANVQQVLSDMVTFMANADNIPTSEANYYAIPTEMRVQKGTGTTFTENEYPAIVSGGPGSFCGGSNPPNADAGLPCNPSTGICISTGVACTSGSCGELEP